MSVRSRRLAIAALSTAGFLDAVYMLAFDEGLLESLFCPFFGEGCEIVGRSRYARHLGVPNAVVGGIGYATMATLALWDGTHKPSDRKLRALAVGTLAAASTAASVHLLYDQGKKVGHWCFWCLTSSALCAAITPLAVMDAVEAVRGTGSGVAPKGRLPLSARARPTPKSLREIPRTVAREMRQG
jgi:uncharacterized membrane protein